MKKTIKYILISVFLVALLKVKINVFATPSDSLVKNAKSAVLIEVESGEVLYSYNEKTHLPPASMTKVMTMKLVLDAIKTKRLNFEDYLETSPHAAEMGGTQIYLAPGEKMKAKDLFKSMVIGSANDAAVVLAEKISGSEEFFVKQMNNETKQIGLKDTFFKNATGLPVDGHYTTALDMAMIARNLLLNYEDEIIPITSTYESYVRENTDKPFWLVNTNKLIKQDLGIDGLKTGWTENAGYCLTCTKKKDGMRLISVVMGADSVKSRTKDTIALLDYGFANFEKVILVPAQTIIKKDTSQFTDPKTYNIKTSTDVVKVTKKGEKLGNVRIDTIINDERIKNNYKYDVGEIYVYVDDELIGKSSLELDKQVKRVSFIEFLLNIIGEIF